MDTTEAAKVAVEIADALGEVGGEGQAPRSRVVAQIARMIGLMGMDWIHCAIRHTLALATGKAEEGAELLFTKEGKARMPGAIFFAWSRACASAAVGTGRPLTTKGTRLTPREFFSTFCWGEPAPKKPRVAVAPVQPVQRVRPSRIDRRGQRRAVEVYRRARA